MPRVRSDDPSLRSVEGADVEAALLIEPGRIEIADVQDPIAQTSQALVHVRTLGVRGAGPSDVASITDDGHA